MFTLCKQNNISFQSHHQFFNQILGGFLPIISLDLRHLLTWHIITKKSFSTTHRHKIPKWFDNLQSKVLVSLTNPYHLILPYYQQQLNILSPSPLNTSSHFNGHIINFPLLNNQCREFVFYWDLNINSFSIGRIYNKDSLTLQFSIEHWISDSERSFLIPLYELHEIAKHHFFFSNNLVSWRPPLLPSLPILSENLIETLIISPSIKSQLLNIQHQFSHSSVLEFYTDGSLLNPSSTNCSMTCGFLQTSSSAPYLSFVTKIDYWPSAFRAELAAVIFALLVSPLSSYITIYTDCESIISHYQFLHNLSPISYLKSHSSNTFNNNIDNIVKQHHISSDVVSFSYHNSSLSPIIPKWNNIIIDSHLRKFLTQLTNVKNFESFINLYHTDS
ncbi:hypothetical protein C1645_840078 [Glomus cerebriforme]|uniref:RNase H type-1 domain-containing protein n=1 Tax=Glomus cerebriforme TaxID=658196 RepID=A0A397S194_9GLOM|nr:hypothetical protein C1645_840078 [Glomus cerebriforme]